MEDNEYNLKPRPGTIITHSINGELFNFSVVRASRDLSGVSTDIKSNWDEKFAADFVIDTLIKLKNAPRLITCLSNVYLLKCEPNPVTKSYSSFEDVPSILGKEFDEKFQQGLPCFMGYALIYKNPKGPNSFLYSEFQTFFDLTDATGEPMDQIFFAALSRRLGGFGIPFNMYEDREKWCKYLRWMFDNKEKFEFWMKSQNLVLKSIGGYNDDVWETVGEEEEKSAKESETKRLRMHILYGCTNI